ncbi:4-alpha-glucanotransferase DPE2-like isoform X1 [Solanum pennellii]|uniref:4-alpha-glucanotransferase DPE2-like isoform X1 n=1 Tax=Solanum pennellii TaxID=28526 RepID=A0ABM1G575_SOLPN|nr:4-alpha-glucanotransferase DPE2-like isoform X1 [Solanum pennellii]
MVNSGLKSRKVSFRIPYYTQWGQNVLICGSDRLLGSWNVKKGLLLKPSHQGEELIWSGSIPVPPGYQSEYSYYVVDDRRNILRWEVGKKRKLLLPDGFQDGQSLELHDLWQICQLFCVLFSYCFVNTAPPRMRVPWMNLIMRKEGSCDTDIKGEC